MFFNKDVKFYITLSKVMQQVACLGPNDHVTKINTVNNRINYKLFCKKISS